MIVGLEVTQKQVSTVHDKPEVGDNRHNTFVPSEEMNKIQLPRSALLSNSSVASWLPCLSQDRQGQVSTETFDTRSDDHTYHRQH